MGLGFNLGQLYMNRDMQHSNMFANNSAMHINALAATHGNYKYIVPPTNFTVPTIPNFTTDFSNLSGYGSIFGQPYYSLQSSVGTKTKPISWEEKANKEAEDRKARVKEAEEKVAKTIEEAKQSVLFKGLTKADEEVLLAEHSKSYETDYKLTTGLGMGLIGGAAMYNNGIVSHGWNSCKTLGKKSDTTMMFKGESTAIKKAFKGGATADAKRVEAVKKLWKENDNLVQEAYYQMHKAERRTHSMLGANKKRFDKNSGIYKTMKNDMEKALKKAMTTGDADDLARVTAAMKEANGVSDGWLRRGKIRKGGHVRLKSTPEQVYNKLMNISKKSNLDVYKNSSKVKGFVDNLGLLRNNKKMSFKGAFKISGGKATMLMSLAALAFEIPNIIKAFKNDRKDGWKQLGQSAVKVGIPSLLSLGGECAGRLIGAKIGGLIGSVVPGIGTAIGVGLGLLISTLVFNGASKIARNTVGDNVVNDIKTAEVAKKKNGANEILETLVYRAQSGEIKDEETLRILSKLVPQEAQPQSQLNYAG